MAKLKVYEYPHPILKKKAEKVEKVDDELRKFLDDMLETMYESVGVGLAAPQVGVSKRIVVIDAAREDEEPEVGGRGNVGDITLWRHQKKQGMNVLFVDGHSRMMKYGQISNPGSKGIGNWANDPNGFWADWSR